METPAVAPEFKIDPEITAEYGRQSAKHEASTEEDAKFHQAFERRLAQDPTAFSRHLQGLATSRQYRS